MDKRIQIYEQYLKELKEHLTKIKKKPASKEVKKEVVLEENEKGNKMLTKKFSETKEKVEKEIESIKKKLDNEIA